MARALANGPQLLLMDEPMAGLDARAQHQLLDTMDQLQSEGTTIVLSTHDLSCVSVCAGQVACLNRRLIAFGEPSQVLTEEVLNQTFGTHLLMVHMDGQAYAYQHHAHPGALSAGCPGSDDTTRPARPVAAGVTAISGRPGDTGSSALVGRANLWVNPPQSPFKKGIWGIWISQA